MNIVLDNIDNSDATGELLAETKLTALLRRAQSYMMCVVDYCPFYTEENKNKLGFFNLYTEDYESSLKRLTLKETYDKIFKDLQEAEKIELPIRSNKYIGNTCGAHALFAYFYMMKADYHNALKYADKALSIHTYLSNYQNIDWPMDALFHGEVIYSRNIGAALSNDLSKPLSNHAYMSQSLIDLYGPNDLRFTKFTKQHGAYRKWYGTYYKGRYEHSMTVPLMMVIKAECEARVGDPSVAIKTLNDLRITRIEFNHKLPEGTRKEAINHCLDEIRREMRFTPYTFLTLKRLNAVHEGVTIKRTNYNGEEFTITPDSPRWTMAIPRYYISLNPEIIQNPR